MNIKIEKICRRNKIEEKEAQRQEAGMRTMRKENTEFRILSAIAIILVVAGHLGFNAFDLGGLFPYYSFHVFIFLFVSGYFYKKESEEHIMSYIAGKCKTLLLPYFVWNVFYGLVATLLHKAGFVIGQDISLYTLFVAPFENGHHFMYHFPAWFVPVLFVIEVINVCMRKVLGLLRLNKEWLIFAGCLLAGVLVVALAIDGRAWGYYKIPGRILFMLPGFQMGCLYREKIEKHDTLPDKVYFPLVMGAQLLISLLNAGLAFSAVWVASFANGPFVPYLTVMTGIAFWLRISRILAKFPGISDGLVRIGRNTFSVMMHHIFVFFLFNTVFYFLSQLTSFCSEFDKNMYFADVNYVYMASVSEAGKWLYLIAGIMIPLWIGIVTDKVKNELRGRNTKKD